MPNTTDPSNPTPSDDRTDPRNSSTTSTTSSRYHNPLDSSNSNALSNADPHKLHDDETNPFVAFRRFADAQVTAALSVLSNLTATTSNETSSNSTSPSPSSSTSPSTTSTPPSTTVSAPASTSSAPSSATLTALQRFAEGYDRGMDPNRIGLFRDRKLRSESDLNAEREKERERNARRDEVVFELWTPPLPDREMLGWGWWDRFLGLPNWPLPFSLDRDVVRDRKTAREEDRKQTVEQQQNRGYNRGHDDADWDTWTSPVWRWSGGLGGVGMLWRPSVEWMQKDSYSPLILEQQARPQKRGSQWRRAFEDLLVTERAEFHGVSCGQHARTVTGTFDVSAGRGNLGAGSVASDNEIAESGHNWLCRLVSKDLVHPGHEHDTWGWRGSWGPIRAHWSFDLSDRIGDSRTERRKALNEVLQQKDEQAHTEGDVEDDEMATGAAARRQQKEEQHGKERDATPATELDMYEHFLSRDTTSTSTAKYTWPSRQSQQEQDTNQEQHQQAHPRTGTSGQQDIQAKSETRPMLIGTSTTTTRHTLPDGTIKTKTVVKKRYVDGSEDKEENTSIVHGTKARGGGEKIDGGEYGIGDAISTGHTSGPDVAQRRGHVQDGKEPENDKQKEKEEKSWFWSSS